MESAASYYSTYHGHEPEALRRVAAALREADGGGAGGAASAAAAAASGAAAARAAPPPPAARRPLIWLAGDSSLDNKFWLRGGGGGSRRATPACNGEERALLGGGGPGGGSPLLLPQDVAHCVNERLAARGLRGLACVNAAVEESTLADRAGGRLLPQDEVLRDELRDGDVVVASVGGNDVALRPSLATAAALAALLGLPGCCCSCMPRVGGARAASVADGSALGLQHLLTLFGDRTRDYLRALLSGPQRARPALVIVCMIYFPLEAGVAVAGGGGGGAGGGSWADAPLALLGYDRDPAPLQAAIRSVYARATSRITLAQGAAPLRVAACPLFEVLDARDAALYEARVEPSARGAARMAAAFVRLVEEAAAADAVASCRRGGGN